MGGITFKLPLIPININLSKVQPIGKVENKNYNKVFVIGFNKTGTTTLKRTLMLWGFKIGKQQIASMMVEDYANERYDRIIRFCKTADAFQDVPFSFPGLYKILDKEFPDSKFILSVRDDEHQWYKSLTNFHAKKVGKHRGELPTEQDLSKVKNIYEGFLLDVQKLVWSYPKAKLYDEINHKEKYLQHILEVRKYFKGRPEDMLEINVADKGSFDKLTDFLNIKTNMKDFPWVNKTKK